MKHKSLDYMLSSFRIAFKIASENGSSPPSDVMLTYSRLVTAHETFLHSEREDIYGDRLGLDWFQASYCVEHLSGHIEMLEYIIDHDDEVSAFDVLDINRNIGLLKETRDYFTLLERAAKN